MDFQFISDWIPFIAILTSERFETQMSILMALSLPLSQELSLTSGPITGETEQLFVTTLMDPKTGGFSGLKVTSGPIANIRFLPLNQWTSVMTKIKCI